MRFSVEMVVFIQPQTPVIYDGDAVQVLDYFCHSHCALADCTPFLFATCVSIRFRVLSFSVNLYALPRSVLTHWLSLCSMYILRHTHLFIYSFMYKPIILSRIEHKWLCSCSLSQTRHYKEPVVCSAKTGEQSWQRNYPHIYSFL